VALGLLGAAREIEEESRIVTMQVVGVEKIVPLVLKDGALREAVEQVLGGTPVLALVTEGFVEEDKFV
jgi:hypothetical protein